MEMDTIYFFRYDSDIDNSVFVDKIETKDVTLVEPFEPDGVQIKTRYAFRLEAKDKVHIFAVDYAIVANSWCNGVKESKRTAEEVLRTELHQLRKNVDILTKYFRNKRGLEVLNYVNSEFERHSQQCRQEPSSPDNFYKGLVCAQEDYSAVGRLDSRFLIHFKHTDHFIRICSKL